jgi:hypothetical protein
MLMEQAAPFEVIEKRMRSHGTKLDRRGMNPYACDSIQ